MSLATTTNRADYTGNGSTTVFALPVLVYASAHVKVYLDNVLQATGYAVSADLGDPAGVDVTFDVAPAADVLITLLREVPLTQTSTFAVAGAFPAKTVEKNLDLAAMADQQLSGDVDRVLRQPPGDIAPISDIPAKAARASKFLAFNANGDPIAGVGTPPAIVPFAVISDYADFATAVSTIGSNVTTLLINALTTVSSNVTVPSTLTLWFLGPGQLSINGGVTVAINGPLTATPKQIFSGAGTVAGLARTGDLHPEWWGAVADGTTDNTSTLQATLDVAATNSLGRIVLLDGTYITGKLEWTGINISLVGAGSGYGYSTSAAPRTILKAKAGTTIVLDLVQVTDITGNYIADLEVDGNSIAQVGIDLTGANIVERVRVRRCTTAGIRMTNINSSRLVRVSLINNTGWGLLEEGISATTFSVTDSVIYQNTAGGVNLEGGVLGRFQNCVIESNLGPGLRLYKPAAHTNAMFGFEFDNVWLEDNASTAPNFALVISAETANPENAPARAVFRNCHISVANAAYKYMSVDVAKWVTFESCNFAGSTHANAVTLGANAHYVAFIESAHSHVGIDGITDTQADNAIAQGTRSYFSDRTKKRAVGSGAPAVAFQNSWVNYGAGLNDAKYWFDSDGYVNIEGFVKNGSAPNTTIFTLPVGYRPSVEIWFTADGNGAYSLVQVKTSGAIINSVGSTISQSLNGIRFQPQ